MKKIRNPIPNSRIDSGDITTRLYRAISDTVRHLDDHKARIDNVKDLFTPTVEILRMKLKDYCDKLMFTDPIGHGKKAEELLWRKGFHEVVYTMKRLNKGGKLSSPDVLLVQSHLQSGVGHYHHLIMKLQAHFRLNLCGFVDFPLLITDNGLKKDKTWWTSKTIDPNALEWAYLAIHRCLIYLGDLCRYLSDLEPNIDHSHAHRYYTQAFSWRPEYGWPFNQVGTLLSGRNYGLDSTYYYMRSLCCNVIFDGSEENLLSLLENNAIQFELIGKNCTKDPLLKQLLVTFIQISYSFYTDKNGPQVKQIIGNTFSLMDKCMKEMEEAQPVTTLQEPVKLTDDMLFKIMMITILCLQRLQKQGSSQTMGTLAFCLTLISQVILCALKRIEIVVPQRAGPVNSKNNIKPRRRRRRRVISHGISDVSEDEETDDSSHDSDVSEEDLIFDQCHESEDDSVPILNGKAVGENGSVFCNGEENSRSKLELTCSPLEPWNHEVVSSNKAFQHFHKMSFHGYIFQTIKVSFDWMAANAGLMKSCGQCTDLLIRRIVGLLNHLCAVPTFTALKEYFDEDLISETVVNSIPLPEDIQLRGILAFQPSHSSLNWDYLRTRNLHPRPETYIRICKMVNFGKKINIAKNFGITFDEKKQWFSVEQPQRNGSSHNHYQRKSPPTRDPEKQDKLMQDMGQLWLKSEAAQNESKPNKKHPPQIKDDFSPYLVPDFDAILNHSSIIRHLLSSKKFILLVPGIVVSTLDEHKQASGKVRDTIRWLDIQLRKGHRFIRVQRNTERLSIPFIKYPKKKEKEAWLFLQVVECCHYLTKQSTGETNSELVTLLTGSKTLQTSHTNGFSPIGVAKSAGVNVESIEVFYNKWKTSRKSPG